MRRVGDVKLGLPLRGLRMQGPAKFRVFIILVLRALVLLLFDGGVQILILDI